MSIRAVDWALKSVTGLKKGEKIVLVALSDFSDESGASWPTQGELAKKTGLRRETVNRSLKSLEKKGLVESSLFFSISNEKQKDRKTLQSPRRKKMARK
jgi:Sugar-specific transcriptional regulator TrmB.